MINKIKSQKELKAICFELQKNGKSIVFTNGCFDIIHKGHILYLQQAKKQGGILIVALNSDASVKRLKGSDRPVNSENDRALVMAALTMTDYVVIFEEDTPYNIIMELQPDVLVKGGDWQPEEIVGNDIVQKKGGKVISLNYYDGYSTTGIIEKAKVR